MQVFGAALAKMLRIHRSEPQFELSSCRSSDELARLQGTGGTSITASTASFCIRRLLPFARSMPIPTLLFIGLPPITTLSLLWGAAPHDEFEGRVFDEQPI